MDEVVKKLASLGLPGAMLVIVIATTGLEGNVVVPMVLATLGGPFGMMGGLAVLGIVTLVTESLAGYGIEKVLSAVYTERSKNEALGGILREINSLPISDELKIKLKDNISNPPKTEADLVVVGSQVAEIQ
ncbi:hypothetical protein [Anabaena sp. UHCC 0399]|uniref:hypothetical protein n=1 Tax=Anabaena sp. UHCC 0399 TaxID=3110238 RepID=UPI001683B328|nr:hypothetical protein [Anabaena sp. UHCC 0399]MBD2364816.1 hypothetical protein [Anabaena minutissima FACHB-250]MEA5568654.1 hypothetical protein [Anabaena sp. UHCC 0399]